MSKRLWGGKQTMLHRRLRTFITTMGLLAVPAFGVVAQGRPNNGFGTYNTYGGYTNGASPLVMLGGPYGGPTVVGPNGQAYDPLNNYNYGGYNYGDPRFMAAYNNGGRFLPRTSDSIDAARLSGNRIDIAWQGEPSVVSRIQIDLMDKNHRILKSKTITALPAEARFARTQKVAYYQVTVEYLDGSTNKITSSI